MACQDRINGWINVDGVHNFADFEQMVYNMFVDSSASLMSGSSNTMLWQEILDYCEEIDTNDFTDEQGSQLNSYGHLIEGTMVLDGYVDFSEVGLEGITYVLFSNHNPITEVANSLNRYVSWDNVSELNMSEDL